MTAEIFGNLLIALVAAAWLGDFVRGIFQRKKVKADSNLSDANATQIIIASTTTLLKPLQERIDELEDELKEARDEVKKMVRQLQTASSENQRITIENQRITSENKTITDENRRLRLALGRGI